jgi:dihydroorotase
MRIRLLNGRIIDPANGIDVSGDLYIADGKILSVLDAAQGFVPDLEIDASNRLVCPGFIDLCARFREPGQEYKATIASESRAAAGAGVTGICCPPDTIPVIDSAAVVELLHQRADAVKQTRIFPLGALTHGLAGERLAEMFTLIQAGCAGVSNANSTVNDTEVLRRALEYAASFGITVFLFAQDKYLCSDGVMHEGAVSTRLGLPAIPSAAENVAVAQAIQLIELTGCRVHFCRISSARSIAMISEAKKSGLPVSADTGICHLHLIDEDVDNYNVNCHLVPPLGTHQDREALCQAITDGVIDAVCSDHQPHDEDAKSAPFSETEPGASTIDVLFPLMLDLVKKDRLSLVDAVSCLTVNPAAILGINAGTLGAGSAADITIIDPDRNWQVTKTSLLSAGKNSPFLGSKLTGKVTHTLLDGRMIYSEA